MTTGGDPVRKTRAGEIAGITCTICDVVFETRDDRLTHWVETHPDMLPVGFSDRLEDDAYHRTD